VADPLGLISSSGGVNPLQPGGPANRAAGVGQTTNDDQSFKDLLMKNLEQVNELQQDATQAIEDLQTGRRDDLESVLVATQHADHAFRLLLQVRNKVVDAYEELRQMQI